MNSKPTRTIIRRFSGKRTVTDMLRRLIRAHQ